MRRAILLCAFCVTCACSPVGGPAPSSPWTTPENPGVYCITCFLVDDNDLYAGGGFAGEDHTNFLSRWDGSGWEVMAEGDFMGLDAISIFGGELIVGGWFQEIDGLPITYLAVKTDGAWEQLAEVDGPVNCLTQFGGNLILGGCFQSIDDVAVSFAASYDGESFLPLGDNIQCEISDLVVHDGQLFAGGNFIIDEGDSMGNVAVWDGEHWATVGGGVDDRVFALASFEGSLIAGGIFDHAGDTEAQNIAAWDGEEWQALGGGLIRITEGLNEGVKDLVVHQGNLYAGGRFCLASEYYSSDWNLARWDGEQWQSLGANLNGRVFSMASYGDYLVIAGFFSEVAGQAASRIAFLRTN